MLAVQTDTESCEYWQEHLAANTSTGRVFIATHGA